MGGLVLLSAVLPPAPEGRAPSGVKIEGIILGGLSEAQAREAVIRSGAAVGRSSCSDSQKGVVLTGAGTWTIAPHVLGVRLDPDRSARLAVQVGSHGTPLRRWGELLLATGLPAGLPACYGVDAPQARVALRRLALCVDREPQPARCECYGDEVRLRLHRHGRRLDVEATLERLQRETAQGLFPRRPLEMALVQVEPKLTAQTLQDATEQLGEARVALKSGARWANVRAGLRALDGGVLRAGSTVSACEELLPLSPTCGFRFASDEQGEVALGGGVEVCLKLLATAAGRAGLATAWRELSPELAALLPLRRDLVVANSMTRDVVISAGTERGYAWVHLRGKNAPGAPPTMSFPHCPLPIAHCPSFDGITLALVGDVLPSREAVRGAGFQPAGGLEARPTAPPEIGALMKNADLAFANLECPISSSGRPLKAKQAPHEWAFRAPPPIAREQLRAWGLDVVSLANNHALDYGPVALEDTRVVLAREGVRCAGAGVDAESAWRPVVAEREGLRVGFICCVGSETLPDAPFLEEFEARAGHPGMAVLRTEGVRLAEACRELTRRVRALRWQVDLLIVSIHWGKEATGTPTAIQRELARAAAAGGADLVVGHHPHRLQPLELATRRAGCPPTCPASQGCLVAYSLGNFVFPARRPRQRHTGVLLVRWGPRGIVAAGFVPARIEGDQPRLVADADLKRQITQELLPPS
jgi:poly-gamma-glutamate synthesis protein (capsule biosynthesis protein)